MSVRLFSHAVLLCSMLVAPAALAEHTGTQIADQGNRALQQIRHDSAQQLRECLRAAIAPETLATQVDWPEQLSARDSAEVRS